LINSQCACHAQQGRCKLCGEAIEQAKVGEKWYWVHCNSNPRHPATPRYIYIFRGEEKVYAHCDDDLMMTVELPDDSAFENDAEEPTEDPRQTVIPYTTKKWNELLNHGRVV